MFDAMFIDNKTIRLFDEYPVSEKEIKLIIIPKKTLNLKRKAGLLKGKIRMSENFNDPLEDIKEYME